MAQRLRARRQQSRRDASRPSWPPWRAYLGGWPMVEGCGTLARTIPTTWRGLGSVRMPYLGASTYRDWHVDSSAFACTVGEPRGWLWPARYPRTHAAGCRAGNPAGAIPHPACKAAVSVGVAQAPAISTRERKPRRSEPASLAVSREQHSMGCAPTQPEQAAVDCGVRSLVRMRASACRRRRLTAYPR